MWIMSFLIFVVTIFSLVQYNDITKYPIIDWVVRATYGSLHRFFWALALAWIVVACINGYGGNACFSRYKSEIL